MPIRTILVEDNERIRAHLIPAMAELAAVVVVAVAETQADALVAVENLSGSWRLIVIDLLLREGSGIGVLRGCTGRRSDQVALVLTNYPTDEMRRRCKEVGADGVFDKSTELDAFFARCLEIEAVTPASAGPLH